MSEPFIGEIRILPYSFAPRGWALCDGATLSIAQNTTLFAVIGTTYGGDGRTNFQLPNLKGSAVMGWGNSPSAGLNTYLGLKTGASTETLTVGEMPKHTHQVLVDDVAADNSTSQGNTFAQGGKSGRGGVFKAFDAYSSTQVANQALSDQGLGSHGNGHPHENRQPFMVTNYCIAIDGLFPSRS